MRIHYIIFVSIIFLSFVHCKKKSQISDFESGNSPYLLDSIWKDQNGKETKLKDFSGKYVLMSMFYSSCDSLCPRIVSDIKKLDSKIPKSKLKETIVVLISLDEEKDSTEKMKAYAQKMELDESRWMLLSGNKDSIRELSAVLEIDYKKMENGEISHSAVVSLLSKKGEILAKEKGIGGEFAEILKKLE